MASNNIQFIVLAAFVFLISCQDSIELSTQFSCENMLQLKNLETVNDFNKNFSVKLPKYWNTKLYFDDMQSGIFSADTLKSLSESYIIDFAMIRSSIEISEKLSDRIHQKNMDNMMETSKESFHSFKGNKAYAHLGKGKSRGLDFYVFQYYIKMSSENYMLIKTEFYSEENFENRLCEAINLIKKIDFK